MRVILILVVLLLAGAAYLYLYPDAGRHFGSWLPLPEVTGKTARLYKWRNPQGEWQIPDTPPPEGVSYEKLEYRDDENVLPVPPGVGDTR